MANFKSYIFDNVNYVDIILYQFGSENCEPLHSFGPSVKKSLPFSLCTIRQRNPLF